MKWVFEDRGLAPRSSGFRRVFETSEFGEHARLAWPNGACEPATGHIGFVEHLAVIADVDRLYVIDANRPGMLEISIAGFPFVPREIGVRDDELCVGLADGLVVIPFAELAALADRGTAPLEVVAHYRERRPAKRVSARGAWVMTGETLINVHEQPVWQTRIPHRVVKVLREQTFELVDELWPRQFARLEIEGRSYALQLPRDTMRGTLSWRRIDAKDPAAGATDNITRIGTRSDAADLLAQVHDRPDDLEARAILIDLLGDAGETCAETFALLAAGKSVSERRKREALGPLGHYLRQLEFRGGLPWAAVLAHKPPTVPDVIAAAAADVRLGLFETLRVARGPAAVFEQLVTTRVLAGLRRVDVVSLAMMRKLRKLGYTQLVQLGKVPVTATMLALLGDRVFANVADIEFCLDRREGMAKRLDAIVDGKASLANRRVSIATRRLVEEPVAARLFSAELGCTSLTISGVTRTRDGDVSTAPDHSRVVARVARGLSGS